MKKFPLIALSCLMLFLAACAGTGTKDITSISFKKAGNSEANVFFYREKSFAGSAGLVKVLVNGQEIGKLGIGEFEKFKVKPGQTSIKAAKGDVLQLGATEDAYSFAAEAGKSYYFILSFKQGLFTAGWKVMETSERGFKSAVQ